MSKNLAIIVKLGLILLAMAAFSCGGAGVGGGGKGDEGGVSIGPDGDRIISKRAREDFIAAVQKYKAAEKIGWNQKSCQSVAESFADVAKDNNNMAEALYNVGVAYSNCKMTSEAKAAFKATLKHHPNHQLSITHLAVMELDKGNERGAEELLRKAVGVGKNKVEVVPAYVNAATILRKRGAQNQESLQKAQLNLRRALAIESKYMPALYQLAMLYLDTAVLKKKASFLTLATLVCNQAITLDPEYGPIYHALGQILLQQNELVQALQSFEAAFKKDPTLFASYMNYAAINLNFRGYQEAKMAFEKAIAINPKNYDAHIGLGVALRGLGDFQGARAEYKKASAIEPGRTDYIFNLGVLEMDYLNQGTVEGYKKAKKVFKKFVAKSNENHKIDPDGKGPELSWHAKAESRIKRCDKNAKAIVEAEREMREMEKLAKEQAKREAEMKKAMEKAKELEKKEAAGQQAPDEGAEKAAEPAAGKKAAAKPADKKAAKPANKKKSTKKDKK